MNIFMERALEEAQNSLDAGGIPTGAVLVKDDVILGSAGNTRIQKNNPLGHAIINAIIDAGRIGSYSSTTLYTTTMPCLMCSGAIIQFGIPKVIVADNQNFSGPLTFLETHSVEGIVERRDIYVQILSNYIKKNPDMWYEDIGQL